MKNNIFTSNKIFHHLDQLNQWKNSQNVFPITIEIDATNICNNKCPGCCGGFDFDKSSLSLEEMKKIILEISELGGKGIIFTGGGDPLCNFDIVETVKFAKLQKLDIGLITNGSLIHKHSFSDLTNNCKWIRVSLDAGSFEMRQKTHGTNDFEVVVENIKSLVNVKKDCTIGLGYLTGKNTDSYEDMMDFVDLSISLEVDYAQFRPYLTTGKKDLTKFVFTDFDVFQSKSTNKTVILTSQHKYNQMKKGVLRNYDICYGHQFATVICANGDMTICCHTRGIPEMTIGSIKNNTIKEIWNSDLRKLVVNSIDVNKCPLYCRCDSFNEILFTLKKQIEHVNFL